MNCEDANALFWITIFINQKFCHGLHIINSSPELLFLILISNPTKKCPLPWVCLCSTCTRWLNIHWRNICAFTTAWELILEPLSKISDKLWKQKMLFLVVTWLPACWDKTFAFWLRFCYWILCIAPSACSCLFHFCL